MRLLVVDDHPLTRDGIRHGLLQRGMSCVFAEADDVETAVRLVNEHRPDVVLVDLHLGAGSGGIEFIAYLRDHCPKVRILVLSQAPMGEILRAVRAGAHGYVDKSATAAELAAAVTGVVHGPVLPPELAAAIVAEFRAPADRAGLTARERDVLRCLATGYDNREIAADLGIAVRTVNRHLEAVRDKLGTRRRSELIRLAREWSG